jgi:hypothetical protein
MESPQPLSIKSIGFKYGIIATVVFILVFLIARALNLNDPAFRFVTYILLAASIAMAFNEVRRLSHKHRINYLPGLGLGAFITIVTAVLYAIFMLIYCNVINKDFIAIIRPHLPFQDYMSAGMLAFAAFGETFVFGIIASFVMMQLFKRNRGSGTEEMEEAAEHPHADRNTTR